ncbi:MAG: bi-domain-containing oxidoreductase, partial [Ignavibacteriales bacterium]|nr:bi-domain-containing oxidoreductase [Ignavibacteriales bacterium]
MKQVVQHNKTGNIEVQNVPPPVVKAGHILVQTHCSVISAGTERASVAKRSSSLLQQARKNPELVAKVLDQVRQHGLLASYRRVQGVLTAWSALGYSVSGVAVAVGDGVDGVRSGDRVACAGAGYASHAEFVLIPKNLCVKIPNNVTFEEAAYTTIGSIALQGVRQAAPTLGETVAVIGLGLIGQITIQLLKANGCSVVGIDIDKRSVALAKESGADVAIERAKDVQSGIRSFTRGVGVDAVIITAATSSNDPVQLAGELCRERGRVVLVGDVGLALPRGPYYTKELDFKLSRSYGPGRYDVEYEERGHDYPIGHVRWTERRNMAEVLRLISGKNLKLDLLTTHRFAVDEAKKAYALIASKEKRERYVGVLLTYDAPNLQTPTKRKASKEGGAGEPMKVGFVGAGSFAQAQLLPHLKKVAGISLEGVCTGNGLNSANVARTFGFSFATANAEEIFQHESIGTVFIAARHNLHAPFVVKSLTAGKCVFVEKPLALNDDELSSIIKTYSSKSGASLMVGFNRRFSPDAIRAKEFFGDAVGPFTFLYRVNAGYIPNAHWTKDPVEGGGRIIGEVCHFVDLMQFFCGSVPVRIFAERLGPSPTHAPDDDSAAMTIRFNDGSVGTILYEANSASHLPKEYV